MDWKSNRGLQVIIQGLNTSSEDTAWVQVTAVHALHPCHSLWSQELCLALPGSTGLDYRAHVCPMTHTHTVGLDGLAEVCSERFLVPR